jgi:hypothetical protein
MGLVVDPLAARVMWNHMAISACDIATTHFSAGRNSHRRDHASANGFPYIQA